MRFAIKRSATWPRLRITLNRSLSLHKHAPNLSLRSRIRHTMNTPPENVHPYHLNEKERERFLELFHSVGLCAFEVNYANGWWKLRDKAIELLPEIAPTIFTGCLGLVTSEAAEAMEAVRKHDPSTWGDANTKDTMVREMAGTIVRCMDLAHRLDLPLGEALLAEIEANAKRGHMHGGKRA